MQNVYGLTTEDFIKWALKEDEGSGDETSLATIAENAAGNAVIMAKQPGILAGIVVADMVFNLVDPATVVTVLRNDGDEINNGDEIISVSGRTRSLLKAERLVLNCMQRMSGIATKTKSLVRMIRGTSAKLLDTRKTTPNFRQFEKWAVQLGGGVNHRFGLYDMILIKDNHIDASGGIQKAIDRTSQYLKQTGKNLKVEIETRSLEDVRMVLAHGGVHRIMLDNFSIADLREAVSIIANKFETEASGGITEENIRAVAETGVNFISVGALTHSYQSLDISMKIIS